MIGQLFTHNFLTIGIRDVPVWNAITDAELDAFVDSLRQIYSPFKAGSTLNETTTEDEIIIKVLSNLGWNELLAQQVASKTRREDVPDMLLFPDAKAKTAALKEKREDRRYRHGIAILESKRWMRPLDRGDATDPLDRGTPSNQILRYLSTVEIASNRAIRWGMLTNGSVWRLYYQGARSRSEEFLQLDIAALLGVSGTQADLEHGIDQRHALKVFYCLFRREAFQSQPWDSERRTFHEFALAEARRYEELVSQDLGQRVFDTVFPDLATALASGDPKAVTPPTREYLDEVREAALLLLYRLLFVLYAEDRGLLPVRDQRYYDYSLRQMREDISSKRDANFAFSTQASRIWEGLKSLFTAIAKGDPALGLPAYNGGLFDDERTPLLARTRVTDVQLAHAIDEVSRRAEHTLRAWINYRDLSVQHLGGIYERLLEFRLESQGHRLVARPTSFARKGSGSYYTHDDLVKLLINETVGPLVTERIETFDVEIKNRIKNNSLPPPAWEALTALDPASCILELKVCDPAMGSGHFLVALVDYLADAILENMARAAEQIAAQRWAKDIANPWASPVADRIADIRNRILKAGRAQGWSIDENLLDDRHVIRRMILKRVIYGVDKNPMAVELAKVALWLHTFTVGAPLSFLDHHLRCGDALFGERIQNLKDALWNSGSLLQQNDQRAVDDARTTMQAIGELTDIDIAEAHQSKAFMDQIENGLRPQLRALDFMQARRWASKDEKKDYDRTWADLLNQEFGDALESITLLSSPTLKLHGPEQKRAHRVVQSALALAREVRFLHWELAFPTVWSGTNGSRTGGFDAVIGNPPWDRMKLQEVEWFAERRPEIAKAARAADRKKMIAALQAGNDPLWAEYTTASDRAEASTRIARECGEYPLLSGGDINLYSLFVERAAFLTQENGMVGLLAPSGIAADKGAAKFFRSISTTGRLSALFDFENRKNFFGDIHSNIKFCALVFSKAEKKFNKIRCAFFLEDTRELKDESRVISLSPIDMLAMNPNTGTLPVFRNQRDANLIAKIYKATPVLVDRRINPPRQLWPVRYTTMFHMTNDSGLFLTKLELEKDGWYPVNSSQFKKGIALAAPLYAGRMIWHFDHRAASVGTNIDNPLVATVTDETPEAVKSDVDFSPTPQYWVRHSDLPDYCDTGWLLSYRAISNPTNARTLIASVIPAYAAGNSLSLLLPENLTLKEFSLHAPVLLANLNSMVLDYVTRIKMQWTNLNWYIVEQLPVINLERFEKKIGKHTIADFVRGEVLRLSYTAHDLEPFARDLGYRGAPFKWDEDDRRHRMARLDALFFQLYGLSRDDAAYILDTFPIVREQDEKACGRYLTKDLVLAYMNAVAAGDLTTIVRI